MPDIEKVIKAWEIFRDSNPYEICDGREFRAIAEPEYCMGQMIADTIELLKEQEAVVHPESSCEMTYITNCCCDLCGAQLIREDNFCRCCGKRIEREGR